MVRLRIRSPGRVVTSKLQLLPEDVAERIEKLPVQLAQVKGPAAKPRRSAMSGVRGRSE